jgi:hypothetical protein
VDGVASVYAADDGEGPASGGRNLIVLYGFTLLKAIVRLCHLYVRESTARPTPRPVQTPVYATFMVNCGTTRVPMGCLFHFTHTHTHMC